MSTLLRILMLEDSPTDAELNERILRKAGIDFTSIRVENQADFIAAMDTFHPDLILADYHLPGFDGVQALRIAHERLPDTPYIFVTGAMGEGPAVETIKLGATDYILKDRLSRLPTAVARALEEKETKSRQRESEVRYSAVVSALSEGVVLQGRDKGVITWNPAAEHILGLHAGQLKGMTEFNPDWQTIHEDGSPFPSESHPGSQVLHDGVAQSNVIMGIKKPDGTLTWISVSAVPIFESGETLPSSAAVSFSDITGRRQAEACIQTAQAELRRLLIEANHSRLVLLSVVEDQKLAEAATEHANRALATLSAVNRSLVHAVNEEELLQKICEAIVQQRGYQLAWVGYKQPDENKIIKIMAHALSNGGSLDVLKLSWAEDDRGLGPCGRAISSGKTQVCQNISDDPYCSSWMGEVTKLGYLSSIALPLMGHDNAVFGTLVVFSNEMNAFTLNEIALLEETAGDLAFGVRTLHVRAERDIALKKNYAQLQQLQRSLESTVRAIALMVEIRDPYTAGHQNRVADLAAAIARQIGLPNEQVRGIHIAGIVHDLGKIQIPAEILSKPGKITDIEFSLIKTHAQAGYNILKNIEFPWPVAQMVLQHHERLDGSGYPQGLKGDEILLEARILTVSDVTEAMSSHRPYRPGLGTEAAMAEIVRGSGTYYDPQVVNACLTLFREKQYVFPS